MRKNNIATMPIHRTDALYLTLGGGEFEQGNVKGRFAATTNGVALVVYINEVNGEKSREAYEIRVEDAIKAILAARK